MNRNEFLKMIEQSEIADHKEYLCQVLRPAIDILKNKDAEPRLGGSRFGGASDLPAGSEWPSYGMKPYRFLGQINFSEIPSIEASLPSKGLLSLFVADDNPDDGDYLEAFEDGYIHAIYIPDSVNLETICPPNSDIGKAAVIEFSPTVDIPYDEYQLRDWPFKEDQSDSYSEVRDSLHKSSDYLLGYPSHYTLAYNPTPGADWISLLTIDSDDDLEWCWHDGDKLMIFIEKERLKNLDFTKLKADAG
ncbi:YwqG family protein [Cytobacillus massiliigabonensis]|uniref:YwqG family protein n=1 Tax=Cytobacillus massiliigabonensis TaxID=1871011 RepID=UPI001C1274AF|nr:YwqG family protein [Cytobacillus massiliigabonensis]